MSGAENDAFIKQVGRTAKSAAIVKGGAAGFSVGSAAASELLATGLAAAVPSGPGALVIVPTVLGAYAGYRIASAVFGED